MNQSLYIKLRDAKNRLLGRTKLIEQFIAASNVVQEALQHMPDGERKKNLCKARDKIQELTFDDNEFWDDFNPYYAKRSVLKKKLAEMQQIIMKYNLGKQK